MSEGTAYLSISFYHGNRIFEAEMTVRCQRFSSVFLNAAILLSLLSLIIISLMAVFQLTMGAESKDTYMVLFVFTFVPSTVLSWSSFAGRLMCMNDYPNRRDAVSKLVITLVLSIVLSAFSIFLFLNL